MPTIYQDTGYGNTKEEAVNNFYELASKNHGVGRDRVKVTLGRDIQPSDTFDKRRGYHGVYSISSGNGSASSDNARSAQPVEGTTKKARTVRIATSNVVGLAPGAGPSLVDRVKRFSNPFK